MHPKLKVHFACQCFAVYGMKHNKHLSWFHNLWKPKSKSKVNSD